MNVKKFVELLDANASMKTLKRRFGMTKEEIERNLGLLSYHRLYLKTNESIKVARHRTDITIQEKTRVVAALRLELMAEWKRLKDAKVQ